MSRLPMPAVLAGPLLLIAVLTSCAGAPTVSQLQVTSLVTTCGTDSDDCMGPPAKGAGVVVSLGAEDVASAVLDDGGRVEFTLDPGEYQVVVTMGRVSAGPSEVVLSSGQQVNLQMNLSKPAS